MQRIFAILKLTWKAAFRYRLFWVLVFLLLGAVVALPLIIKDDGTARGFTQIRNCLLNSLALSNSAGLRVEGNKPAFFRGSNNGCHLHG